MHFEQTPVARVGIPAQRTRIAGLDLARIIACLGVIWLHTGSSDYNALGFFRMPFFTALLAFLVAAGLIRNPDRNFFAFARSRAFRILLPFAIWLVLYRIPNIIKGHLVVSLTFRHVLTGLGTVPLWFLSFAFCASLLAFGLSRGVQRVTYSRRWVAALALIFVGSIWSYVAIPPQTVDLWDFGMPLVGALALGVAVAFLRQSPRIRRFIAREWIIWTLLWVTFGLLSISLDAHLSSFFGTFSGMFLLLAGLSVPLPAWPKFWLFLGRLSYGMYLTHWAFVILLAKLPIPTEGTALPRFAFIVAGSFVSTLVLQRVSFGRFLLGVESFAKRKSSPAPLSPDERVHAALPAKKPEPALVTFSH